jgi:phosphomannomutase
MAFSINADYRKAFKDADIRGRYPTEIDEQVTMLVAKAFCTLYALKEVVVARDMRLSSPALVRGTIYVDHR